MTETEKKFTVPGPVPVDAKKLIDGLGTIFGGVIQLLAAMEPNMAKELADMAINGVRYRAGAARRAEPCGTAQTEEGGKEGGACIGADR